MSDHSPDSSRNDNELTLQSYQDKAQEYIEVTPQINDVQKTWIDGCLTLIPKTGKILEVGSGFGRDAEYIKGRGFEIECTDAVPNFIDILKEKGFNAYTLNVLKDPIKGMYDMVLADAVLLHFTPQEATHITKKIHAALNDAGIFGLRTKKGNGANWTDEGLDAPRYFYYWQPEKLKKLLTDSGFEYLAMAENHTNHNNADWMCIIARKVS